jgi:hypothetical protein
MCTHMMATLLKPARPGHAAWQDEARQHFADAEVIVDAKDLAAMDAVVGAVNELAASPIYRDRVLAEAPPLARAATQPDAGLFAGFDFHLTADGPKLIEINTNAGGAFYGALLDDLRHDSGAPGTRSLREWQDLFVKQVRNEWALAGRDRLRTVAIVDDMPEAQFLKLEFEMAAQALRDAGIDTMIVAPQALSFRDGALLAGGKRIDLVYNRLTSFALDRPEDAPLRDALEAGAAWITPGPRAHALLACKKNLVLMGDAAFLGTTGISAPAREALLNAVPETIRLTPENAAMLWDDRDQRYFKPLSGYGSRGVYAGSKLTRKAWDAILATGQYVAQREVPPSRVEVPGSGLMRCDVRTYAYRGHSFMRLARLYRGQTTNFRTPGGGFAPVLAP